MTVTAVDKDPQARTMTITAEFEAGVERVWRLWSEPRQLERWWGPPGNPITVTVHELRPDGKVGFVVAGDDARLQRGWRVLAVEPPHRPSSSSAILTSRRFESRWRSPSARAAAPG